MIDFIDNVNSVIDVMREQGLKYRVSDFCGTENQVYVHDTNNSIVVSCAFNFPRCGKALKSRRHLFRKYKNVHVSDRNVSFYYSPEGGEYKYEPPIDEIWNGIYKRREAINCLDAIIYKNDDGTYDCPWLVPHIDDITPEEYKRRGTALSVRRGCFYCYAALEWRMLLEENGWREDRIVAHAKHPNWPGEWVSVPLVFDKSGRHVGFQIQFQLFNTLHEAEHSGWELIFSYFPQFKAIYNAEE